MKKIPAGVVTGEAKLSPRKKEAPCWGPSI